jgi:hypothetical protein
MLSQPGRRVLLAAFASFLVTTGVLCATGPDGAIAMPVRPVPTTGAARSIAALPALGLQVNLDNQSSTDRRRVLADLAAMGASWVREGVAWHLVEPNPGALDTTALAPIDNLVADAATAGLRVLLTADDTAPAWATTGTAQDLSNAYGHFTGLLAARYKGKGPAGTSPAYELMNEPNGGGGSSSSGTASGARANASAEPASTKPDDTPTDYAHAACAANTAVHTADSSATVVAGAIGADLPWMTWAQTSLQAGLAQCFDVLSMHSYSGTSPLPELRTMAADAGRPNATIWLTEFGATTCTEPDVGCVTEDQQSSVILSNLDQLQQNYSWVPVAMIYQACDLLDASTPREQAFGVYRSTTATRCSAPKAAVAAITNLYSGG